MSNCSDPDYNAKYQTKEYRKNKKLFKPIINNSDVVQIYYNIIVTNNNTGFDKTGIAKQPEKPVACLFNENRQNPYLDNPSNYDVTVPYFHLDSNSFPIQVVQPIVGSVYFPSSTANGFTIEGFPTIYGGIVKSSAGSIPFNIKWKPADNTLTPPSGAIKTTDLTNEYFYNYSYQYFIDLLNDAIGYAMNLSSAGIPYFSYNQDNKKFYFNAPATDWNNSTVNELFLNEQLYNLLAGFPSTYNNYLYKLTVKADPGLTNVIPQYSSFAFPLSTTSNYVSMEQNYQSYELWNPVVSVIFKARNLNVVNTQDAIPIVYGLNPNPTTNNAKVSNVLFEYGIGRRLDPVLNYEPSSEYVLTNLLGITESRELQLDVFWKDDFGNLHTFYLEPGSTFIMKLLFRQKGFNY